MPDFCLHSAASAEVKGCCPSLHSIQNIPGNKYPHLYCCENSQKQSQASSMSKVLYLHPALSKKKKKKKRKTGRSWLHCMVMVCSLKAAPSSHPCMEPALQWGNRFLVCCSIQVKADLSPVTPWASLWCHHSIPKCSGTCSRGQPGCRKGRWGLLFFHSRRFML